MLSLWRRASPCFHVYPSSLSNTLPSPLPRRSRQGSRRHYGRGFGTSENFLQLLYGPNAGLANLSRFKLAEFDRLYDASKKIPPGPERDKLVREMSQIVAAYAPWKLNSYRIENVVVYPWVIGYKYNPFNQHPWQDLDMDMSVPRKSVQ